MIPFDETEVKCKQFLCVRCSKIWFFPHLIVSLQRISRSEFKARLRIGNEVQRSKEMNKGKARGKKKSDLINLMPK